MNERMYELINQCFIGTTEGKLSELNTVANIEKFAELIVRECCFIGEQWADGLFDPKHYAFVNKQIKRHFGVEE